MLPVPQVGHEYYLSWSTNPTAKYKLLSWSNNGECRMQSRTGKIFNTHLNHIRSCQKQKKQNQPIQSFSVH